MGIDMSDIRHVIRNGVPENILSWAQELGTRKVWTGWKNATATILYDLSHANAWVLNNVSNRGGCKDILSGFADSWKYVNAHLAGLCRRKIVLRMFNEEECCAISSGSCCDVCEAKAQNQYVLEERVENLN